jgi:hypothetical protein
VTSSARSSPDALRNAFGVLPQGASVRCGSVFAGCAALVILGACLGPSATNTGPNTFGTSESTSAGDGSEAGSDAQTDSDTSAPTSSASDDTSADATGVSTAGPCDPLTTACGVQCVNTQSDPSNCGDCGISCVIPNGTATCDEGNCAVASCDDGFGDCDGDPMNGCESQASCSAGADCTTECGSTGTTACPDGCNAVCMTPEEACNGIDDSCDGQCDVGLAGCRVGVHRAYGGSLGHLYTTSLAEAQSGGFELENQNYFWLYADEAPFMQPFFRCPKAEGRYFFTTSTDCEGTAAPQLTVGFIAAEARCNSIPLYRLYSDAASNHFYTTSEAERDNAVNNLGYLYEGLAGHVWAGP